ncbi:putative flippase [Halalkaliarchaeum sp. AArc-CO]|uniref:lysylphosphatidylglycerol synthase transmembrane domain-containing protein n=1 Tax=Halalkaliarchaeum sp. AArc-CO TaxID=2866381 RepID=UPI00217E2DDB|nr:lysylphosphatidylglycerol synthase transmembrane domain-containing protein [Halalkaliarchaeum sp. AArc-CO]UWG52127.1 putative flippase [Halalkaliarchaeum sp. AArc-CO]
MNRKHLLWLVGIALLVGLTVAAGWRELSTALRRGNPLVLLALCGVQVITLGIVAYQWQYLLGRAGAAIPFRLAAVVTLAGTFVESATPSSKLGGMAATVYLFERTTDAAYDTLSSVLLAQKYVSLPPLAILVVGTVAVAVTRTDVAVSSGAYAAVGGFVAVVVVLSLLFALFRRWGATGDGGTVTGENEPEPIAADGAGQETDPLTRGISTLRSVLREAGTLLDRRSRYWLYTLAFLLWVVYPLKIYVVAVTLGVDAGVTVAFVGTYLAYLVSLAPISPGGTGTFEGTLALVYVAAGVPFVDGLSIALLGRVVTFWFPLVLSAVTTGLLLTVDDAVPSLQGVAETTGELLGRRSG